MIKFAIDLIPIQNVFNSDEVTAQALKILDQTYGINSNGTIGILEHSEEQAISAAKRILPVSQVNKFYKVVAVRWCSDCEHFEKACLCEEIFGKTYKVAINDFRGGLTVGELIKSKVNIGDHVKINLLDENSNEIEAFGTVVEILQMGNLK